jgi:aspartate kinase
LKFGNGRPVGCSENDKYRLDFSGPVTDIFYDISKPNPQLNVMPLIVQKFGGTSVADPKKILAAARKAVRAHQDGSQVVVVVSAMGKNTDGLIDLAKQITDKPAAREMDMLLSTGEQVTIALMAMAVDSMGYQAISLTGGQIGIKTDSSHTKARIHSIATDRIQGLLDDGKIVIAAGFQGIDEDLNITTLGRGGSDTTAVSLAAVLGADQCEIYTDVDGIYTTDPRKLPAAKRISQVCYDEMLELASLGAGVMHSRSIEFGKKFNVPIHVRSSMSDEPGSLIVDATDSTDLPVSGVALTRDEALVTIVDVPDVAGTIHKIFAPIAEKKITVDMIVQNVSAKGKTDISFTLPTEELPDAIEAIEKVLKTLGGKIGLKDENVSKVSAVGLGMAQQTGVANRMFRSLADAGVNLQIITTSEIKISALVKRDMAMEALKTIHGEFALDQIEYAPNASVTAGKRSAEDAQKVVDVINRMQQSGMEALMIDSIALDQTQSRITLQKIPNQPGVAANLFQRIAKAGVFVDMIVQSYGSDQNADITFTVKRDQLSAALEVAQAICDEAGCAGVDHQEEIAKLSVRGIGLRSHTGVAIALFKSLAEADINVEMVNTSEVQVNVVVAGKDGDTGLEKLKEAFADSLR